MPFLELLKYLSKPGVPMLRRVTRHRVLFDRILDDSTFRSYFQQILLKAGYCREPIIHTLRRAVANIVDRKILCSSLFTS